jgi:anti-sigma regulatory factor (Ser/Thr protein kinase)
MNQTLDLAFPREPAAIRAARGSLGALASPLREDAMWRAKLVVSELATNVVRHAAHGPPDQFEVHVRVSPELLRLEICNSVPPAQHLRPSRPENTSAGGMGLYLVDRVADRWGIEGSCVWAEIDLSA